MMLGGRDGNETSGGGGGGGKQRDASYLEESQSAPRRTRVSVHVGQIERYDCLSSLWGLNRFYLLEEGDSNRIYKIVRERCEGGSRVQCRSCCSKEFQFLTTLGLGVIDDDSTTTDLQFLQGNVGFFASLACEISAKVRTRGSRC